MARRREGRDLPEIVGRLFDEARSQFPDPQAVNRTLLQLCRLYDPVSGGIILEHETRRRIVDFLAHGKTREAGEVLQVCFEEYRKTFEPPEKG